MGDPNTLTGNQKSYGCTNIKAYVPLILDLNDLNYDSWRELFKTCCTNFGVLGHLTGTSTPTNYKDEPWYNLDYIMKMWLYGTVTQLFLNMILKPNEIAHMVWTSLEESFCNNKDPRAIELDNQLCIIMIDDDSIVHSC